MPSESRTDFSRRVLLGRTGLEVSRLGIGSSYGIDGDSVERAYHEKGINYLYWGTTRRRSFGAGIRRLAAHNRKDLVVVVQTYTRIAALMRPSLRSALRGLGLDDADVLVLGYHNHPPSAGLRRAAENLRKSGEARYLGVSCHRRSTFRAYVKERFFDVVMFRYSAAHRGAEIDILPLFEVNERPGSVAYTATRWGELLHPDLMPPGTKPPSAADCYRFVLTHPGIDVCLTGPADARQLAEAMQALEEGPMEEEEIARMHRIGDHVRAGSGGKKWRTWMFQAGER
jgi:aryl-alcohol dehydrogenase-like predicted oxidoreductase